MFKRKMQTVSRILILQQSICIVCANKRYTYKTNIYDILGRCKLKKKLQKFYEDKLYQDQTSGGFWNQGSYVEIIAMEKNQKLATQQLPSGRDHTAIAIVTIYLPLICQNQQILGRLTAKPITVPVLVVNSGRSVK